LIYDFEPKYCSTINAGLAEINISRWPCHEGIGVPELISNEISTVLYLEVYAFGVDRAVIL